jgi:hypothetical protein
LLSAGFVFVGTTIVQLTVAGFAMVNVLLGLVWLAIAFAILKHHRALTQESVKAA